MLTLYDAARCPYCARVRIQLAEKRIGYDPVEIDLDDRPAWIYEKNPVGRVPVLEEDGGFVLPESRVIMEYLEERFPEPALLPGDPAERALVRLAFERFEDVSDPYYAFRREQTAAAGERFDAVLGDLDRLLQERPFLAGTAYGLADIAYVPWILRAEANLGIDVRSHEHLGAWLGRLEERPAVAAEVELLSTV
ncbi:MAG: glutathione S-transferase family protein [Actinobacteria bacterium]|nr:MAG: glutathione S-transferase family protein [Actinomycetota bacterium]